MFDPYQIYRELIRLGYVPVPTRKDPNPGEHYMLIVRDGKTIGHIKWKDDGGWAIFIKYKEDLQRLLKSGYIKTLTMNKKAE